MVALHRMAVLVAVLLVAPALLLSTATAQATIRDAHPESQRWVEGALVFKQPSFLQMDLNGTLTLRKFTLNGESHSVDELSDAYLQLVQADEVAGANGHASHGADDFLAAMEDAIESQMFSMLRSGFPTANLTLGAVHIDAATFQASDSEPYLPGVKATVSGTILRTPDDIGIHGRTESDLRAVLDAGAGLRAHLEPLRQEGYDLSYHISPPPRAYFASANSGTRAQDGSELIMTATRTGTAPVDVVVRGTSAPEELAQDADIAVLVDLQDLQVSFGQAIGGDFGKLLTQITIDARIHVLKVSDDLAASLPPQVELDYVSADGIRILVDRGVVTEEDLARMEAELLDKLKEKLGATLGGDVPVKGGFDRATLAPGLIKRAAGNEAPIVFHATARVVKPLAGGPIEPAGPAAIALYSQALPLSFPKIQSLDTVYTVILPRGLAVQDVSGLGGTTQTSKAPDGRDQFTVTPTSNSQPAQMTVNMAVTPTFVMAKFWPVVLIAVILVVLIVGTPIALVVRSKGKKKAAGAPKK